MSSRFTPKLTDLGFELPGWVQPPCERLVHDFESRFTVALPSDYREFLVQHGGVIGIATCEFQEPTPCGNSTCVDGFFGFRREDDRRIDVVRATELIDGSPDVVAIADNLMGAMFWLKCSGKDRGCVYMHDPEGRFAWPDELFYERFPNLDPTIECYLRLRKRGELPAKPKGYEHVYRLATSFDEFIARLEPPAEC